MSVYPDAIDGYAQIPLIVDNVTPVNAASVNPLREAILAIEEELGLQPSGVYDTVRARLDALEFGGSTVIGDIEARLDAIELALASLDPLPPLANIQYAVLMEDPAGTLVFQKLTGGMIPPVSISTLALTAGEGLALGELVRVDTLGQAIKARADLTRSDALAIGVSSGAFTSGSTANLGSLYGSLVSAKFGAAPLASSNGEPVFLSELVPGEATLTAPSNTGEFIYFVGVLQGADGITSTPDIIFQPRMVAELL